LDRSRRARRIVNSRRSGSAATPVGDTATATAATGTPAVQRRDVVSAGGATVSLQKWHEAKKSRTLMEAHDAVSKLRPRSNASEAEWLNFYLRSAAVYAEIAEVDRGHHHEALYWADRERRKADEIAASNSTKSTGGKSAQSS
jgi:hypothetical protein